MAFQDIVTDVERAGEAIRSTLTLFRQLSDESRRLTPLGSQTVTPAAPPPPVSSGLGAPRGDGGTVAGLEPVGGPQPDTVAAVSGSPGEPPGEGTVVALERFQGDLQRVARQVTRVVETGQQDLLRRLDELQRENRELRRRLEQALRRQDSPSGNSVDPGVAADSTLLFP